MNLAIEVPSRRPGAAACTVSSRRRRALLLLGTWVGVALAAGAALAQRPSPHAPGGSPTQTGIPDVPAGRATIRGRVVHETDPKAVAGVPIVLYALGTDGSPGLRGMVSEPDGSFAFEGIAGDPGWVYLVGARYREVPFGVRLSFAAGETEREVELSIAEPTTDGSEARVAEVLVRIDQGCEGLLVKESHALENTGDRVIYVPESERSGREPILRVPVPPGARHLESTVGETLDWDGQSISYWGPLRPGREEFEFAYGLPAEGERIEFQHAFPHGAGRVRVFSQTGGPVLSAGEGDVELRAGSPLELDGESFATLESARIAPGATLALVAEMRPSGGAPSALSAEESRIWLDLDGAALTIDEQHELTLAGDAPIASSGAPLLCFALDPKAEELRFSNETLALGLTRDPSGAIAVRGPLLPGATTFAIRYRVPVEGAVVAFERSFPLEIPLLSVLIADTGIRVETADLHRRRPTRTQERKYLHLEAFGVAAGKAVRLSVEPLPSRAPLAPWASAGLVAAAAVLAFAFITVPLRSVEEDAGEAAPSHYAEERQSVLASLRSLEDDFEMGKLSEDDYSDLRQQLRASAVALLRAERETAAPARVQPSRCAGCGAELASDARFCSQCGTPVEAGVERSG